MRFLTLGLLMFSTVGVADGLESLDKLVDSCWRGAVSQDGKTDTHCWRRALNGRYVIDSHVVRGGAPPYSGDAYYRWNTEGQHLEFWYFNSIGGMSTGVAHVVEGGLDFPEERYTSGDETRTFRVRMRWRGTDAYESITEEEKDGEWIPFRNVAFVRETGR